MRISDWSSDVCSSDLFYNPISKARPHQLGEAFALLRRHLPSSVPVIFGRAVGRTDEMVRTVRLQDASADMADMATCIIVGSPETRIIERDGKAPLVYSPRSYRGGRDRKSTRLNSSH